MPSTTIRVVNRSVTCILTPSKSKPFKFCRFHHCATPAPILRARTMATIVGATTDLKAREVRTTPSGGADTSTSPQRQLYPPIEPFNHGFMSVSGGHEIYWEQCGNPKGKPVVFAHGGPGGGCSANCRQFFDPEAYHIILFDQRGAGRSRPFASLDHNTTWDLVSDMELLRKELRIEKWLVFGGSWGSTLALAYAETHPAVVTELVLRGIFTLRQNELSWFYEDCNGASMIFPDAWEPYLNEIPEAERGNMMLAYNKRLTGDDEAVKTSAAKAWAVWEGRTSKLIPDPAYSSTYEEDKFAIAFARIENHYFVNNGWFSPDNQLIANAGRIAHIPTVIIQGRYDLVCPMRTAWDLHKALPESEFVVIPTAGHSAWETGITSALLSATDKFRHT